MSTMQDFHTALQSAPEDQSLYHQALSAITQATREQVNALSSDLSWQNWGEQNAAISPVVM